MADDNNDDSTTFLRQRRDLFVISAILLLIPIAEIHLADQISMQQLGISLYIGKPEVISSALWVLWAYWYIRYCQAFKKLNRNFFIEQYRNQLASYLYMDFKDLASKKTLELQTMTEFPKTTSSFSFTELNFNLLNAVYEVKFSAYDPSKSKVIDESVNLEIRGSKYFINQIKSLLNGCIKNIEFTEFILPFLFGITPLLFFIYKKIL